MNKSVNKVELSGFAGMNPEVHTFTNGTQMLSFSLATSNNYKNSKDEWVRETTWHRIVMFGKVAELAFDKIRKGTFVRINGKIATRQYTDKHGTKHNIVEIIAYEFEIVQSNKKQGVEKAA